MTQPPTGRGPLRPRALDMTRGDPLRLLVRFSWPLLVGNIFQQLYGIADTMAVGYALGEAGIAAIGATAALYLLIINIAIGLSNGYAVIVTQAVGAGDAQALRRAAAGMITLTLAGSAVLTAVSLALLQPLLRLMNTPEGLFPQAYAYIAVLCAGLPATLGYNALSALLRAMGDSKTPLLALALACAANIALDILLVIAFPLGVAGAALATVLAQAASALLCGAYLYRGYPSVLPARADFSPRGMPLKALALTGGAMALALCAVDIGSVLYQGAANRLGDTLIAANAAARRVLGMLLLPLSTLSMALATFIGQNYGAGDLPRVRRGLSRALALETAWAALACALMLPLGEGVVRLLTGSRDALMLQSAAYSLRAHVFFLPVLAVVFCLKTAMQAMGKKAVPVLSSALELLVKAGAACWLIPRLGFSGVCFAEPIAWALMAAFLIIALIAGRKRRATSPAARR